MVVSILVICALIANGAVKVEGVHFRGGTMNWRPTGTPNEVLLSFNMAFGHGTRTDLPDDHRPCTEAAKADQRLLETKGHLKCDACSSLTWQDMQWRCQDFDEEGDWDLGGDSFIVTVQDVNQKAVVYHPDCCWVYTLVNRPESHVFQGYKMMTEIDLRPRPDNGLINSSPITEPLPVQLFHSGCKYHLEIEVTEPDNDPFRCRYTRANENECYERYSTKYGDICGRLDYIDVYDNCTLVFDTSGGEGHYAVRVMVEDLLNGQPLSKISLSFLLEVSPDDTTCETPKVFPPKGCKTILVNEPYQETIIAQAATAELEVVRIESIKPRGMTASELENVPGNSLQKSKTLYWTPNSEQVRKYIVQYRAVDNKGFTSPWSQLSLNVVDGERLSPVPTASNPTPNQVVRTFIDWSIRFNRPILRPSESAYITLFDKTGNVVDKLDSSKTSPEQVHFKKNKIVFSISLNYELFGTQTLQLSVGEGVAIDAEHGDCVFNSSPDEWPVIIQGSEKPGIKTTPEPPPTKYKPPPKECESGNVDVTPPSGGEEGEECIIYVEDPKVTITQNKINVPYQICCPSECEAGPPSRQPQPPGYK